MIFIIINKFGFVVPLHRKSDMMNSSSISSSGDELDDSFRQMLMARKPLQKKDNKENISPSNKTPKSATAVKPPTQFSRIENDADEIESDYENYDEDFDAQLQTDGAAENEEELKAMERLLNEIRSPIKMVEMLRPSTIYEEQSVCSTTNSSMHTNSFVTAPNQTMATTTNDDDNMSKDSLMTSGWSVDSSASAEQKNRYAIEADSLIGSRSKDQFNETLEEMEYVRDNSKYLLQPVNKVRTPCSNKSLSRRSHKSDNNVIVIESSPESSFETAKDKCFRVDIVDLPIKIEQHCESITISDDDDDDEEDEPVAVNVSKQK